MYHAPYLFLFLFYSIIILSDNQITMIAREVLTPVKEKIQFFSVFSSTFLWIFTNLFCLIRTCGVQLKIVPLPVFVCFHDPFSVYTNVSSVHQLCLFTLHRFLCFHPGSVPGSSCVPNFFPIALWFPLRHQLFLWLVFCILLFNLHIKVP